MVLARMARGGDVAVESLRLVLGNPRLVVIPLLGAVAFVFVGFGYVLGTFGLLFYVIGLQGDRIVDVMTWASETGGVYPLLVFLAPFVLFVLFILLWGFVQMTVRTFFSAAFVHSASKALEEEPTGILDGLKGAWRVKGKVLAWGFALGFLLPLVLIVAVGLLTPLTPLFQVKKVLGSVLRTIGRPVFRVLEPLARPIERAIGAIMKPIRGAGGSLGSLPGAIFSMTTYFIVPVMVLSDGGPTDMVEESASTFREQWAEGVSANFGIDLVTFLLVLPLFAGFGWLTMVVKSPLGFVGIIATFTLIILLLLLNWMVGAVVKTALYLYAANGTEPAAIDGVDFETALDQDRRREVNP